MLQGLLAQLDHQGPFHVHPAFTATHPEMRIALLAQPRCIVPEKIVQRQRFASLASIALQIQQCQSIVLQEHSATEQESHSNETAKFVYLDSSVQV